MGVGCRGCSEAGGCALLCARSGANNVALGAMPAAAFAASSWAMVGMEISILDMFCACACLFAALTLLGDRVVSLSLLTEGDLDAGMVGVDWPLESPRFGVPGVAYRNEVFSYTIRARGERLEAISTAGSFPPTVCGKDLNELLRVRPSNLPFGLRPTTGVCFWGSACVELVRGPLPHVLSHENRPSL